MGLGTHLGFRERKEMTKSMWGYFKLEVDPHIGLRKVTAVAAGGFDKMHNL